MKTCHESNHEKSSLRYEFIRNNQQIERKKKIRKERIHFITDEEGTLTDHVSLEEHGKE